MSDKSANSDGASADAPGAVERSLYGTTHLGEVPLDEVFPFFVEHTEGSQHARREYIVGGVKYSVKMSSPRYRLFKVSRTCVACGLDGTKLILDLAANAQVPHFNLYGEENGHRVLMTKDHIVPASRGGTDVPENFRVMCAPCNVARGNNDSLTLEQIKERRIRPGQPAQGRIRHLTRPSLGLGWELVQAAYEITSALSVGDRPRARKGALALGHLLGNLYVALDAAESEEARTERAA